MHTYRNRNTGEIVKREERSVRFEVLDNWEEIEEAEADAAPTEPDAAAALAAITTDATLTSDQIRARLERADAEALMALAEEYEIEPGIEHASELADDDEATAELIDELTAAIAEDRGNAPPAPAATPGEPTPAPETTELTGEALDKRAAELNIEGRSQMSADEKRAAIARAEQGS